MSHFDPPDGLDPTGGGAEPGSVGRLHLKESPTVAAEIGVPDEVTLLVPAGEFSATSGTTGVLLYAVSGPAGSGKAYVWLKGPPWSAIGLHAHLNGKSVSSGSTPAIPNFDPDAGLD